MKMTKIIAVAAALTLAGTAFAADPIVGNWQMSEDGQPKSVVQISESGGKFTGVVVSGQTEKAKKFVGKTVILNAQNLGDGKYKGKAKDPRWGLIPAVNADITLNGNKLTLKTLKGSQVLTRK
ncbi:MULTISPECIES: DUF2147 domain-containing protein [unclassified Moraxella]|uniref:DUF2147 domain-containing protein n=1 Tax=unclassified Moraxella TaxID=2685852 RepID=UPI00359E0129